MFIFVLQVRNGMKKMNPIFTAGDKVRQISGGPEMTVRGNHFDVFSNEVCEDKYDCIWFEKNKAGKQEVHYCAFDVTDLMKSE